MLVALVCTLLRMLCPAAPARRGRVPAGPRTTCAIHTKPWTNNVVCTTQDVELFSAVRSLVFHAAVPVLFGPAFAHRTPGFLEDLERVFVEFEAGFEVRLCQCWR